MHPRSAPGLAYRPEVDGLRAIAVLAVMLFHARVPQLPGGYLGVDIFFVISGYLITGILVQGEASGGLSLRQFYLRRIRRILDLLQELNSRHEKTIVMVTHDPKAADRARHILHLDKGVLVEADQLEPRVVPVRGEA